jgi:hypothetical protein
MELFDEADLSHLDKDERPDIKASNSNENFEVVK